ncbi:hypothetical protein CDG79_21330 [Nostoc sp. 'Peltigera membranacea cyanobiont' 232]|nr:hypothetical protein CDG79_21330 [Nostoc sp. 'Peltigera membranacea cyanobiont' 232]
MQSTDDKEVQPLSNSAFSKDFSRVPISTTKPQLIMAKLTIGAVGDKYEQEADRVAAQVVQRINAPASVQSGEDETVQREKMETKDNEARLMRSPILQRKSSDGEMTATPDMETSINRARGGGQPMANNIRQPMEQAFGADFSRVKVHTDAQSDRLNQSIQARAFTTGQNVFFRQGEYNPESREGQELLAHELTHVVQQNGGAVLRSQSQAKREMPLATSLKRDESINIEKKISTERLSSSKVHQGNKTRLSNNLKTNFESFSGTIIQLTVKEATPQTPNWEDNANGQKAGSPEIQNLKNHPNKKKGSPPSVSPVGWNDVLSQAVKVKGSWVRFHLINDNVGGPGNNKNNLVPTPHAINTGTTWKNFETDLKSHWNKDQWIWCKTIVTYNSSYPDGFPETITGVSEWYDAASNQWKTMDKSNTSLALNKPDFGTGVKTRTLDEMTAQTWSLLTGAGVGTQAVKYLNSLTAISSFDDLWKALYAENAPEGMDNYEQAIDRAIKGESNTVNLAISY